MSNFIVPGIYVQEQKYNLNPLRMDSRCLTGFAGICERGPINKLIEIKSFDEYLKIFGGFETAGVLPISVYNYFRCGGKECVIVRVANEEEAACALLKFGEENNGFEIKAKSKGHWGNHIIVSLWKESEEYFSITLNLRGKTESYIHLSCNKENERYFEKYVNERSKICEIKNQNLTKIPDTILNQVLQGGLDGIANMRAKDFVGKYNGLEDFSGIGSFESRDDISLIAVPDICWLKNPKEIEIVQRKLLEQAERISGRFAILDVPENLTPLEAISWADKYRSQFTASYYPFIDITDPIDSTGTKTIRVPPSGAICGCIAAVDSEYGIHSSPANRILDGAVGLSYKATQGELEMLVESGINPLRYFPGNGVKIWGARTMSFDKKWKFINVRRTFSKVCEILKKGTQWAVFEQNNKNLRKRLIRQVSGFLLNLWRDGYFAGGTAEQGFYVRCDEELNPPESVDAGMLVCEIGLAIVRPIEFFVIKLAAEKDGASVYMEEK